MSEHNINSYRFLSGQEPTDEMLHAIMSEACDAAIKKAEDAQKKYNADYERQYSMALKKWGERIKSVRNGQL